MDCSLNHQSNSTNDISGKDLPQIELDICEEKSEGNHRKIDYLEFIEKLFKQNWKLDDEDVVSPEESYSRLTWLGIILTCVLSVIPVGQIIQASFILWSEKSLIIIQPELPTDEFIRKFPMPHLVTVSESGEVYDFSIFENTSPSRGLLFKLPKVEHYYVFSDPKGILYFVDSQLRRDVTQYHQNIRKKGHQVMPSSGLNLLNDKIYFQSLLINGFFWLFQSAKWEPRWSHEYPSSSKYEMKYILGHFMAIISE